MSEIARYVVYYDNGHARSKKDFKHRENAYEFFDICEKKNLYPELYAEMRSKEYVRVK